jgi:hypothetical protein
MFVNKNSIAIFHNFLFHLTIIFWYANTLAINAKFVPFTKSPKSKPFGVAKEHERYTNDVHHAVHDLIKTDCSSGPYVSISVLVVDDNYEPDSQLFIQPGSIVVWRNSNQTQEHVFNQKKWFCKNSIALWHSAALMSDVVIILLPENHRDENISDLVWALKSGWKHRILSGLSRGRLLLLLPATESNIVTPAIEVWLNGLKEVGLSDVVEQIDIKNAHQSLAQVLMVRCHSNGSHTLTDRLSFMHVYQETFLKLGGSLLGEPTFVGPQKGDRSVETPSGSKPNELNDTNQIKISTVDQAGTLSVGISTSNVESTDLCEELESIQVMINDVRNQQEEYSLNASNSAVPPLDFVTLLNPLINRLVNIGPLLQPQTQSRILQEVRSVYDQHLDLLRDYFGRVYETILDNRSTALADFDMSNAKRVQDGIMNNFRQAAEHALIPMQQLSPLLQNCNISFDYSSALSRMEMDLSDATDMRRELVDESNYVATDSALQARRKRFLKFCKTLAIRTLMLGVNYAQGWIALQGIKRMALEREREMPKFPLF